MRFNKIRVCSLALVASVSGWASDPVTDEAAEKKGISKIVVGELHQTSYKINPSEIGPIKFDSFKVSRYAVDLNTYATSSNYTEISAKVRATVTRDGQSCDAVVEVKKLTKNLNRVSRTEYLFAVEEWPSCL